MNQELISVIIPTYNRSTTLERAIQSVLNQTYKNIEIIVVDDNAQHLDIRESNKKLIKKFKNIIFIENKNNLGGGLTRNEGIKAAKGEYVAFLDDDDEFLPQKLEKQYELFKKLENDNKVGMIYCYANMIKVNGEKYIKKTDIEGIDIRSNAKNCIAACSWMLCSREALNSVHGFEDISSRQDATLIMKLFFAGYSVYRVPEILLNYYWHDGGNGISKTNEKALKAEQQYLELFMKNSEKIEEKEKRNIIYEFKYRQANILVLLNKKEESFKILKEMLKDKIYDKRNIKVLLGIIFNKTYTNCASAKDLRKRMGETNDNKRIL